jgi:Cu2+-exporting ATPase
MPINYFHQDLTFLNKLENTLLVRLVFCGAGIVFLIWLMFLIHVSQSSSFSQELYCWAGLTLSTPLLYFATLPIFRSFFARYTPYFTTDACLFITLLLSYAYSLYITLYNTDHYDAYFDSILLVLFILYTSRFLEIFSTRRVANQAKNLSSLSLKRVKIIKADQQFHDTDLREITVGDKILISPGDYIPVDGTIIHGDTSVDESMLTGEALAIPKFLNDDVRAGTYNLDKTVTILATTTFEGSYLGKMLSSVKASQRYKFQNTLPYDQFSLWHQMIAFSVAFAIFCWWLPFDSQFAWLCLITSLIVTCPCVIAIAYPLTISSALDLCAKQGILIKNPLTFLRLSDVQHILFDKTGTLTEGNLVVSNIEFLNAAKEEQVLPIIAVIEKNTHHPIARAIYVYAESLYGSLPTVDIHRLRVFPGKGVRAIVNDQFILIGSANWLKKNGVFISADVVAKQENASHSSEQVFIHCAIGGIEVARIQLKDEVRTSVPTLMADLKSKDLDLSILSGDHPAIVQAVANQIGAISATAEALPQKKEAQVIALQEHGEIVAMVGDGLNDALALRQADVGIAIGTGNPIAIYCADLVLEKPNLKLIDQCLILSEKTQTILKQNYFIALCFNLFLLPFAALGKLSPLLILISLALSFLMVMANSARLKFMKDFQ